MIETRPTEATDPFDRRHDLDALRATAMLLGIGLHASLAYITSPFWPVYDDRHNGLFDLFLSMVHGFRMPLFFMISGFFTAMLWRKRGLVSLIKHRWKRIALPLIIFLCTIIPLMLAIIAGITSQSGAEAGGEAERRVENLWDAAKYNDTEALARFLEQEEDLNRFGPEHELPALNWAALNGSTEAARMLIDAGADVNVVSGDRSTPLSHAAFTGRADIATLLIEHGADVNVVNDHQSTALDNTHTEWGIVQWVAGAIGLDVEEERVQEGRKAIRELLRQHGGKRNQELRQEAAEAAAAGHASEPRGFWEVYESIKQWKGFHTVPIFHHLWFLWFLCILLVPFVFYALIADMLNWRGLPKWLFRSPWVLVWLVPITMIPQAFQGDIGPDTSIALIPFPHIIGLYFVYFFFGALYFDCDDREGSISRGWWLALPLALLVCYPLAAHLTHGSGSEWLGPDHPPFAKVMVQVLYTWLMIFGLMGLFRVICRVENKAVRYVSDSSYWLYVAHLPLIFVAQYLVKPLDLPAMIKFTIVCATVTAVLLLTYDWFVRYTWLGTLLNGKRTRPSRLFSAHSQTMNPHR